MTRVATLNATATSRPAAAGPREEPSPFTLRILLLASILVLGLVQSNQASPRMALLGGQLLMILLAAATVLFGFLGARWRINFPIESVLAVAFVSWCLTGVFVVSHLDYFYTKYGTLVKTVSLYLIFVNLVRTRKMFLWMAAAYVLTVVSYFFLGVEALRAEEGARAVGVTGDPNGLATYAIIALTCAVICFQMVKRRWVKILFLLPTPAFVWMVANSGSRSGMLGLLLLIGALYWFYIRQRVHAGSVGARLAGLAVGIILVGGVLYMLMASPLWVRIEQTFGLGPAGEATFREESRLYYAAVGLEIMAQHPILGVGYYHFRVAALGLAPGVAGVSHNTWIEAGAGTGFLGLFLWIGAYVLLTVRANRLRKNRFVAAGDRALVGICLAFIAFWWFRSLFFIHLGEKVLLPVIGGMTAYLTTLCRLYGKGPLGAGGAARAAPLLASPAAPTPQPGVSSLRRQAQAEPGPGG